MRREDAWRILEGDSLELLPTLEPESFDAIVTDPPYGLGFMGKAWDALPPGEDIAAAILRVAKPGAHLVAFGGTRTYHRLGCALEDAGWEIRDQLAWVYGSGFPKSLDVSKAIDKAAGADRGEETPHPTNQCRGGQWCKCQTLQPSGRYSPTKHPSLTKPATAAAEQWSGWGTALKPAWEPIVLARKPFVGTIAENVLEHGTGALNADGCRVGTAGGYTLHTSCAGNTRTWIGNRKTGKRTENGGRWPANFAHDGSVEATAGMGDAARYFYSAKASPAERNAGLDGNHHPTVKPLALMRWLCRLVTPPGGTVLDPFLGSGSTMAAALSEGFSCVGIEREPDFAALARRRVEEDAPLFNRKRSA